MATYIKRYTDSKRRSNFKEKLLRRNRLKYYLTHTRFTPQIIKYKTYCQLTGAARSVYYGFALSRHCFRNYANFGYLPGVITSSW